MTMTAYPFRQARSVNATATSLTSKTPTATKPSGEGVIDLFNAAYGIATNTYMPDFMQLVPYGTDADNEQFDMRVVGWNRTAISGVSELWIPQLLLQSVVTMGNIAATAIGANHFMADTMTIAEGDSSEKVISSADDTPASVLLNLRGCELIEILFSLTAALTEGTGANCLWRPVYVI